MILEMAQHVSIPLIGVGGISCAQDAIEYFMAGASYVGVVTAGHVKGAGAFGAIVEGIDRWVQGHGYKYVGDIVGLTLRRIESRRKRDLIAITTPQVPIVDADLCMGCGECGVICVYDAIHVSDDYIAVPDAARCYGCGVCRDVCPEGAIRFAYFDA
jgi:Pyruvate/2-oxoacid:ferredoxin oxidoreductase delta subunit